MPTEGEKLLTFGPITQTITLIFVGVLVIFLAIGALFGALYSICSKTCINGDIFGVYVSSAAIVGGAVLIQLGILLYIRQHRRRRPIRDAE
jgi:uncharacterized membrane protein